MNSEAKYPDFGGVLMYAKMTHRLIRGGTKDEIAEEAGVSITTAQRYIRALELLEPRPLHVTRWAPASDGRKVMPVWLLTPGEDAPRPPRLTCAERSQRYRDKKAASTRVRHVLADDDESTDPPSPNVIDIRGIPNSVFTLAKMRSRSK